MFGPPGIAYVYRIYGVHWCLNVVTGATGDPAAVLIRAVEPLAGLDVMRARRGARTLPSDRDLARGPGRLAEALGITGALDRHTLQQPPLWVATGEPLAPARVGVGPRIGVTRAVDWELRFFEKGSRWVSR
jgi:DNA-3-methyladenine glycosylase